MEVKIKRLTETAKVPYKAHPSDAGFDVFADSAHHLLPGFRCKIKLGIAMEIPEGWCAVMFPRSGLSVKAGTIILANIIDSAYRGEVHCVLKNGGEESMKIEVGDKIAQILICPVPIVEMVESQELSSSDRGTSGFGSSGAK